MYLESKILRFINMINCVKLMKVIFANRKSLYEQYFNGEFTCEWKCEESEEEEKKITSDKFQMLSCHISADVKYLQSGLQARLQVKDY